MSCGSMLTTKIPCRNIGGCLNVDTTNGRKILAVASSSRGSFASSPHNLTYCDRLGQGLWFSFWQSTKIGRIPNRNDGPHLPIESPHPPSRWLSFQLMTACRHLSKYRLASCSPTSAFDPHYRQRKACGLADDD